MNSLAESNVKFLTKREYAAIKIMAGLYANTNPDICISDYEWNAQCAVKSAGALMKELADTELNARGER